jgi:Flp pilus assembly protein TadG
MTSQRWQLGGDLGRARRAIRQRCDRGAVAVETAVGIPMLVLVIVLAASSYTAARANLDTHAVASAAARTASQTRTSAQAQAAAQKAANANLAGRCSSHLVRVNTNAFHRGGAVTVTVSCTVSLPGLAGLGLPGTTTLTATATSPVDLYRARSLGFGITEAPSAANPNTGGA